MIATRGTPARIVFSAVRQVSLSVLGTLAATAVMAVLQAQWTVRPATPAIETASTKAVPDLTDGGKFTARAVDRNDTEPFVSLVQLPAVLPMFTAAALPRLEVGSSGTADLAPDIAAVSASERPAPRHDLRRATAPPRRTAPDVVAMAPLPVLGPGAPDEDASLWSRSKTAYRTVAAWSGAVMDSLLP